MLPSPYAQIVAYSVGQENASYTIDLFGGIYLQKFANIITTLSPKQQ